MNRRILPLLLVTLICTSVCSQETEEVDIDTLIGKLRNLSILFLDTDSKAMIDRQQKKIELADQILEHPDMEEAHRLFATITRIRALGIHFNVLYTAKKQDDDLNETYANAIEEGLADDDQLVIIEATTSQASFRCGLFILDPIEGNAKPTAEALNELEKLGPRDPLVQTTRRVLLEQLWNSDQPKLVFEALVEFDDKRARIVLNELEGATDKQ